MTSRDEALRALPQKWRDDANQHVHDYAGCTPVAVVETLRDCADELASILSARQEVAPVADDKAARDLYVRWVDSQNIHCNRFPSWGELDEETRNGWRSRVSPHPPRLQAAIDQLNGTTSPAQTSEARDAARYRWLRDNRRAAIPEFQSGWDVIEYVDGGEREYINSAQSLDDAIDAAMRQEAGDE